MNLRQQALKGGAYLVLREGIGIFISLGGILLLTRLIGPASYGLYAGVLAITMFLLGVGRFGLDVFLVRREQPPEASLYNQVFTFLLFAGTSLATIMLLLVPFLHKWHAVTDFIPPLQVMLVTLPFSLLSIPAQASLERDLHYRAIAVLGLSGQLTYYVVALSFAVFGWGVWAPVAGYWAWQLLALAGTYYVSGFRPHIVWSRPLLRECLAYGVSYSTSLWVWQLRTLVNPLIVGRFLGPEGVGYVALAIRMVEVLSFAKHATYRISIAVLAKLQGDHTRFRRAIEEAMGLQALAIGSFLAGFAAVSPWMVPLVFGSRWDPILKVFPFIALSYLINSVFNMHSSVLYVLHYNRDVTLFHIVHIVLFAGASILLVPRFALIGYGVAEIVAFVSYVVIHRQVARIFPFSYMNALPWVLGFALPLFTVFLPVPFGLTLWLPLLAAVLLWPQQRQHLREYIGYLRWRTT